MTRFRNFLEGELLNRVFKFLFVLGIYGTFCFTSGLYLHQSIIYRGVETWPAVEAEFLEFGGGTLTRQYQGRFGPQTSHVDTNFIRIRYSVDGITYERRVKDDGGSRTGNGRSHLAFYNPASPNVAVLNPNSFQGYGLLFVAAFSGVFVAGHFWFNVQSMVQRHRVRP